MAALLEESKRGSAGRLTPAWRPTCISAASASTTGPSRARRTRGLTSKRCVDAFSPKRSQHRPRDLRCDATYLLTRRADALAAAVSCHGCHCEDSPISQRPLEHGLTATVTIRGCTQELLAVISIPERHTLSIEDLEGWDGRGRQLRGVRSHQAFPRTKDRRRHVQSLGRRRGRRRRQRQLLRNVQAI